MDDLDANMTDTQLPPLASTPLPSAPSGAQREAIATQQSLPLHSIDDVSLDSEMLKEIVTTLIGELTKCSTIGALTKLVPVPAQPDSRNIFDEVFTACQKRGSAENLLMLWQNKLASSAFDEVPALNSLKAPTVQVCKEALGPNDDGLSAMNLATVLLNAKEQSLRQMIAIKQKELTNLVAFTSRATVETRLAACWDTAGTSSFLTPEHRAILTHPEIRKRFARTATAIGDSAYLNVSNQRQRREETRHEAQRGAANVNIGNGPQNVQALIEQTLARREQSRRDKKRSKPSGKGKGRAGPAKKSQNQKKEKKTGGVRKNRPQRKGGNPTGQRQQGRR